MRPTNKILWIVVVFIGLTLQPVIGQSAEDERGDALAQLGIYPYPSEEEVKNSVFSAEGFRVSPLSANDINQDFSNIEDLAWLRSIAHDHRVVLIGEKHYYQVTQHLRNRIIFALNTFDAYPFLILERPYSMTPYLNYYLLLEDEDAARKFEGELENFMMDKSDYQLLHHLRLWNKTHPDKKIQVGCIDIEHDYAFTFRHILHTYFFELKRIFFAAKEKLPVDVTGTLSTVEKIFDKREISLDELNQALRPLEQCVVLAKERELTGKYPFLTQEYIENVIENLKSYYAAKTQDFNQYRQQAIIRNLTDPRFLGRYFDTGKVIIHGGGYHTPTHYPYPTGENFLREGSYLTYEFGATKGQTFSLLIEGMAFSSVLETQELDIATCRAGLCRGSAYRYLLSQIANAAKQGIISSQGDYLIDEPEEPSWKEIDDFTKVTFQLAYRYQHQPFIFDAIPWTALLRQARNVSPEHYEKLVKTQEWLQRHDLNIKVPISSFVLPRTQKATMLKIRTTTHP